MAKEAKTDERSDAEAMNTAQIISVLHRKYEAALDKITELEKKVVLAHQHQVSKHR